MQKIIFYCWKNEQKYRKCPSLILPGKGVEEGHDDSLEEGKLGVEAEEEEHDEEGHGPEVGQGQLGQGLGVGNKGEALSSLKNHRQGYCIINDNDRSIEAEGFFWGVMGGLCKSTCTLYLLHADKIV